mmetsp:Transcript_17233/g.15227  ORF Transcript_17233/g.15227 Transcript_17233/m.15227 type:complete len:163 (+) Transcript_17233:252-740(+)
MKHRRELKILFPPRDATSRDRNKNKDLIRRRQQEENKRTVRNENMRNDMKKKIKQTDSETKNKRRFEAERLRQEKREQEELVEMYRQQEQLKNTSMKQMIRNNEKEAEEKRRRDFAEKQAMARSNLDAKVLKENQKRMEHEDMVAKMEQEELELIQRLQNTQ